MLNDQGIITICSFISPSENIRQQVKEIIGEEKFQLVYINRNMDACKLRQPDLYEKYENGEISNLPGLDFVYEQPQDALIVEGIESIEIIVNSIIK
jgi:bifunctional enzyme CysN/CysC